jgi:uncharacterized membrane protein
LILTIFVILIFIGVTEIAFRRIGFTRLQVILLLAGTFVGSSVNLPLIHIRSVERIVQVEEVRFFWVTYRIPHMTVEEVSTLVAVNLGGAIIPTCASVYLLYTHLYQLATAILGVAFTAIIVHMFARKLPGLGIATPAFVPPIVAALGAYALSPGSPNTLAYVAGTLGTLIGADLTNLRHIGQLGAPVVSIGGAGTFDGVFLTGIIAALLV